MKTIKNFKFQKGFAAFFITILILTVVFTLAVSIYILIYGEQKISRNILSSSQAYYVAEAGIEDALLRLRQGMKWSSSYSFSFGEGEVEVVISDILGGARTITATGNTQERIRKLRALYQLDITEASLHYGAHIGEGGLHMNHNHAKIIGNVFSNGEITGYGPATIVNSVIVSGEGKSVNSITVEENVYAYSCLGARVEGDVIYHASGVNTCNLTGESATTTEVMALEEFAITPAMIEAWKESAAKGDEIIGDQMINYDQTLGPATIIGNLHIKSNIKLTLRGTVLITGNFTSDPNAIIELSSDYEELSGVMITEGMAYVKNNLTLRGSGKQGSFLLFVSLSESMDPANPAIDVKNNADNAILFAPHGLIVIGNNANVVEILAHRLEIQFATVEYDIGLTNARFTSGPGARWRITSWREIE